MTDTATSPLHQESKSSDLVSIQRLRILVAVLAILLVSAIITAVLVWSNQKQAINVQADVLGTTVANLNAATHAQQQAQDMAATAQAQVTYSQSQRLGAEAISLLSTGNSNDAELAALLSIRALGLDYSPQADVALSQILNAMNGKALNGNQLRIFSDASPLDHAVFTVDGKQIIAHAGTALKWWDVQTGAVLRRLPLEGDVAAFSTDRKMVLTTNVDPGGQTWTTRLIDTQTGNELQHFSNQTKYAVNVSLSPDDQYLLTIGADSADGLDSVMQVWSVQTGKELKRLTNQETEGVFSPNGKYFITTSKYGLVQLDATMFKEIRKLDAEDFAAFSADSRYMLTGSDGGSVTLWNPDNGRDQSTFGQKEDPVSVSPDDNLIVMNGIQGLYIMDRKTGAELSHFADGTGVAVFSPDSKLLLVSGDNRAYILDAKTASEIRILSGHTGSVNNLAFSPDGQYALTGSEDGTVRLWTADYQPLIAQVCQHLSRDLTDAERRRYDIDDAAPTCPPVPPQRETF